MSSERSGAVGVRKDALARLDELVRKMEEGGRAVLPPAIRQELEAYQQSHDCRTTRGLLMNFLLERGLDACQATVTSEPETVAP